MIPTFGKDVDEAIVTLWNFLRIEDQPIVADVIFVFGCGQLRVPRHAASLFHRGFAKKILVSGTMGRTASTIFGRSECDVFFEELIKHGVPSDAILSEREATNTGENIMFGMKRLRDSGIDPSAIIFVATPYHVKRCKATFIRHEPSVAVFVSPPSGDFLDYVLFTKERVALKLVGEVDRLVEYPKLGFIEDQHIPFSVLEAAELIRKHVKE